MRDPIILLVHLIATLARLMGPGGLRSVVAESVLVKQQLLILNRSRHRAPNLCASDRILAGVCALFMRPAENRPPRPRPAATPVATDSSTCFLISTLLLRELSRNQVSKKTLGRRTPSTVATPPLSHSNQTA